MLSLRQDSSTLKLNLGCGASRLSGFINIDSEESCKPDLVCNFVTQKLPYEEGTVTEIVLFHTIEHIVKRLHPGLLFEIWRILKPGGWLYISYPEFTKCCANWDTNYRGKKDFWEATIFGRQLYPSDFHVCIMHTPDFIDVLQDAGFTGIIHAPEMAEPYNTMLTCRKGVAPPKYIDQIKSVMERVKIVKTNGPK